MFLSCLYAVVEFIYLFIYFTWLWSLFTSSAAILIFSFMVKKGGWPETRDMSFHVELLQPL
jgi:hypothetical protein